MEDEVMADTNSLPEKLEYKPHGSGWRTGGGSMDCSSPSLRSRGQNCNSQELGKRNRLPAPQNDGLLTLQTPIDKALKKLRVDDPTECASSRSGNLDMRGSWYHLLPPVQPEETPERLSFEQVVPPDVPGHPSQHHHQHQHDHQHQHQHQQQMRRSHSWAPRGGWCPPDSAMGGAAMHTGDNPQASDVDYERINWVLRSLHFQNLRRTSRQLPLPGWVGSTIGAATREHQLGANIGDRGGGGGGMNRR
mmetsp:Transcript_17511/g.25559  ORF Transcript_17511/g.25559 Transcript_17511/m.25559 type:complete len:248 (-) Transcript_17511:480-1223(-)